MGVKNVWCRYVFFILSVLLIYAVFNKRVNRLVDKALQVCEVKLDKVLKEKDTE
ncbi:hypothetical protein [Helicobacter bilis]|uniref:hypothetical protein n=1 Tax=Helicobacter bilis TaxID=37372 RepID=UPI0018837EAA|nr:hypothetical protein [Helicobacter bilis]